jgi:transaldolase
MQRLTQFTQLRQIGQSIWLDNLARGMLEGGELKRLVEAGEVTGITTNPSIFRNAIVNGASYRADLERLKREEADPERRYERLAIADVQAACDVSPRLAHDADGTIAAARRLHAAVARDNVLIKIPGTPAGVRAFEQCIAEGISVNVTLLFSLGQMDAIFEAYQTGLERLRASGGNLKRIKAVASFFMSRIDSLVDKKLDAVGTPEALALRGKTAVAVGKLAYVRYGEVFGAPRFSVLRAAGATPQYLLWASTSTKNPAYDDLLYVTPLIGPQTINTVPDVTLAAFRDHGKAADTIGLDLAAARATFDAVERLGIGHEATGTQLQQEGVKLFDEAFTALLQAVI